MTFFSEALAQGVAQAQIAGDQPANLWAVIIVNMFTTLPATIAAIGALIVSWRSSKVQTQVVEKQDEAAQKAAVAVKTAQAAVVQVAERAAEVVEHAEQRLSTAEEDTARAARAVAELKTCIVEAKEAIIRAIEANKPVEAKIVPAGAHDEAA